MKLTWRNVPCWTGRHTVTNQNAQKSTDGRFEIHVSGPRGITRRGVYLTDNTVKSGLDHVKGFQTIREAKLHANKLVSCNECGGPLVSENTPGLCDACDKIINPNEKICNHTGACPC